MLTMSPANWQWPICTVSCLARPGKAPRSPTLVYLGTWVGVTKTSRNVNWCSVSLVTCANARVGGEQGQQLPHLPYPTHLPYLLRYMMN